MDKYLVKNAIECTVCGDVIESRHRHDFVRCNCGKVAVDGGLDYIRYIGDPSNIIDRSEYSSKPPKKREVSIEEIFQRYEAIRRAIEESGDV